MPRYEAKREPGNMDNYISCGNCYKCKQCGVIILAAQVARPIHFRELPGSGSGECQYETVPYCPDCDNHPEFHGTPIIVSINDMY